jgi:hypothetical protein
VDQMKAKIEAKYGVETERSKEWMWWLNDIFITIAELPLLGFMEELFGCPVTWPFVFF